MTKPFLNLLHRYTIGKQQRCAAMTQIVEANMPQIVFGKQLWKSRSEIVGRDQCPHFVHTNIFQIPFVIALPTYSSVFRLLVFQLQQLVLENRHKGQCSHTGLRLSSVLRNLNMLSVDIAGSHGVLNCNSIALEVNSTPF